MDKDIELHAYLAGPDVFFPDPINIGKQKKALLAEAGIIGHFPLDNEIPLEERRDKHAARNRIGRANEQMMLGCSGLGRIGIIFANMVPFRGPGMDQGTSFEVGFMSALAEFKNNLLIMGYTDDPRPYEERVVDIYYQGAASVTEQDGFL